MEGKSPKTTPAGLCRNGQSSGRIVLLAAVVMLALPVITGCAAGNTMYTESPAGFWAGLWHGFIIFFSFIISLFNDGVSVYETANKGALYDLGFVLGAAAFFGCGSRSHKCRKKIPTEKEREWEEIGSKVEEKVRQGIKDWLKEDGTEDKEWKDLGEKLEEKIKRELRKWADK